MSVKQSVFSDALQLNWQRANEEQATFSFYQSQEPERFLSFTTAFANQQGVAVKHLPHYKSAEFSPYNSLFDLFRTRMLESHLDADEMAMFATDYKPLQQVLTGWLGGNSAERTELPVLDDLYFEQDRLRLAMIKLVEVLLAEPTVIVVTGWHYASASAIEMLKAFVSAGLAAPVMVMVCLDTQYALAHRQDDECWEGFLDWLDDHYLLNSIPACFSQVELTKQSHVQHKPSYALMSQNMELMAWPEAVKVARYLLAGELNSDTARMRIQLRLAEALLYLGELDDALNEMEQLQEAEALLSCPESHVRLLCLISLTQVRRQSFEYALQNAQMARQVAEAADNDKFRAQSLFINFYAHDKSTTPVDIEEFERLNQLLQSYQMDCSRLYCLRNYYNYLRFYEQLKASAALVVTDQAISLAKAMGHRQGIAAGYHSKGIIYSYNSQYHQTFRCFGVSSRIREELGEALEIVRMHNGIGYFNTLLEQYPQAQKEYLAAYATARRFGDYSELVVTLYNFAWLYFCTRNYRDALHVLDRLVKICRIRQLTHFPFRNLYDVFSLKGFCHAKLGELARAQQSLDRMRGLAFRPSSTGLFLRSLLQGAICSATGDLAGARERFEDAPALLGQVVDMDSRLLPQCYMELVSVYSRQGDWQACNALLTTSLEMCDSLALPKFRRLFMAMLSDIEINLPVDTSTLPNQALTPVSLQLDELVIMTQQDTKLSQANQRLREIQLISRLQSLPERYPCPQQLAFETLKMVCGNFTLQAGLIHRRQGEHWQLWTQVGELTEDIQVSSYLMQVQASQRIMVDNRLHFQGEGGQRATYDSVVSLPLFSSGELTAILTLCAFDCNRYFDRQDQDTLQLLSRQLGGQLQQLEHSERLLKMSMTDVLTGLFNRQALQARLEQELTAIRQQCGAKICSLAYLDLDNFKVINDTLGHGVGDEVLKEFARLLENCLRHEDVAARWGGDEFVVLFPHTDSTQAQVVAERLLHKLAQRHYFMPELLQWANITELPSEIALNCSIGIAECHATDLRGVDEDWLLQQADKALYRAKDEGKGRVRVIAPPALSYSNV
ncbi:diguanylate cyclase [Corallincola spongiicola]|uniref:diguanylate cyclase n=1 Tax=Corallincola spongiicola TaxID=2520508 RepID=A0ABY1WPB8_9GAMM|nr:diguanylate cyclase [Corallincola spongiicola]TAA45915.1 GGDEF domain-containing protein [Corallincola spongiicola]